MTPKSSEKKPTADSGKAVSQTARFDAVWAPELAPLGFVQISEVFLHQFLHLDDSKTRKRLSDSEFVLLVHLMSHRRGNQMVYPSVETLARRMGKTSRQIMRLTARLQERKLLVKHLRRGSVVRYDMRPLVERVVGLIPREEKARKRKAREREERNLPPDLRSDKGGSEVSKARRVAPPRPKPPEKA